MKRKHKTGKVARYDKMVVDNDGVVHYVPNAAKQRFIDKHKGKKT